MMFRTLQLLVDKERSSGYNCDYLKPWDSNNVGFDNKICRILLYPEASLM
jgi:hypothetical protein